MGPPRSPLKKMPVSFYQQVSIFCSFSVVPKGRNGPLGGPRGSYTRILYPWGVPQSLASTRTFAALLLLLLLLLLVILVVVGEG